MAENDVVVIDSERTGVVEIEIFTGGYFLVHKFAVVFKDVEIKNKEKEGGKNDDKNNNGGNDFVFV